MTQKDGCPLGQRMDKTGKCVDDHQDTWGGPGDITVGLWSRKTLRDIQGGKDKWAATCFMNASTFGNDEIRHYPYHLQKKYRAWLDMGMDTEPEMVTFYATDDKMAKRYLDEQYQTGKYPVMEMQEVITRTRDVPVE